MYIQKKKKKSRQKLIGFSGVVFYRSLLWHLSLSPHLSIPVFALCFSLPISLNFPFRALSSFLWVASFFFFWGVFVLVFLFVVVVPLTLNTVLWCKKEKKVRLLEIAKLGRFNVKKVKKNILRYSHFNHQLFQKSGNSIRCVRKCVSEGSRRTGRRRPPDAWLLPRKPCQIRL